MVEQKTTTKQTNANNEQTGTEYLL